MLAISSTMFHDAAGIGFSRFVEILDSAIDAIVARELIVSFKTLFYIVNMRICVFVETI